MKKEFAIPAFARPRSEDADYEYHAQSGMDLRDYFAAKAMQSITQILYKSFDPDIVHEHTAHDAYLFADAMMKARSE